MGMELIAVYEEENPQVPTTAPEGYAQVMLSPQKRQLIGLKTEPVSRKDINKTVRAAGVIANDPEWYQAQGEFIESVKQLERAQVSGNQEAVDEARRFVGSSKVRLKSIGLNDELIDEITTWKEADQNLLYASADKPVWVYAQVYEYELPYIKIGQPLNVEVPSLPNQDFSGAIRGIDTTVNPETRTTRVRARIDNPQGRLKLGMYINALIHVEVGEVLAVPVEAVFDTGERQIVFVDKGEGLLEPVDVKLGSRGEDFYEVQSGLKEGDMVVTSGNFLIDSESRLKASLEGMTGGAGGGHQHGQ
jgi:Cu(I)/Ag(I) efflux system membrane fusion protein